MSEVMTELDWALLGRASCEGDGTDLFDAALRARVLDTGLELAGDLSAALRDATGTSLYLGAEVAEVPVMLAEQIVLGRTITWLNLDGPIPHELARALGVVGARLGVELPSPSSRALTSLAPRACDHLWMVSVLSDPDQFPALHDALYARKSGPLATGKGDLARDREAAERLVNDWLDRAKPDCVVTTTDEELTIVEPLVARRGGTLDIAPGGRISAVVGDRIRIGRIRLPK